MALSNGSRVGAYDIQSAVGAGGMGEVYRARDTKLGRAVALKILPEEIAGDPEYRARFEREARVLAALNHPHIAAIHGFEQSGSLQFLVLEFVDGETLAARIARGPLPIEEAVPIACQLASALGAAHESGVIHRDLKPANIALTVGGEVKVLDFGLAKACAPAPNSDLANSPTLTGRATQVGIILGTAAYMAPEQARGKAVDKRADIWAFGCVLYEMLTGARAFGGEDIAETLGAVIHKEPQWSLLPTTTPPAVGRLLRRCLQTDPKRRLHDIADARIELEDLSSSEPQAVSAPPIVVHPWRQRAAWITAAGLGFAALTLAAVHFRERSPRRERIALQVFAPVGTSLIGSPALSPDGRQLAFTARGQDGRLHLWIRSLDSAEARLLPGTEDALANVFWSPDSRFVRFATGTALKKVDVSGKPPVQLCSRCGAASGWSIRGGTWNRAGVVLYAVRSNGLWRVSENGGTGTLIEPADTAAEFPTFLPDGRHFVYTRRRPGSEGSGLVLASIDSAPEHPADRLLVPGVSGSAYASAGDDDSEGYLLFVRGGTLMAQGFNVGRLELIGEEEPVAPSVPTANPAVAFSASLNGVLAFKSSVSADATKLAWFDRKGTLLETVGAAGLFGNVNVSADGRTVVTDRFESDTGSRHVWAIDSSRGSFTRPISDETEDYAADVSTDGRIAFTSGNDLFLAPVSGAAQPEPLLKSPTAKHPNDWSPDARYLLFDDHHPTQQQDLWLLPMTGERQPIPFLATNADEAPGQFSPDGRYIAYASNETGRREIYVRDFVANRVPAHGALKKVISTSGGDKPRWSRDGKELIYIAPDGKLTVVAIRTSPTFEAAAPVSMFKIDLILSRSFFPFDVAPDGRLLINAVADSAATSSPITVVLNWASALAK